MSGDRLSELVGPFRIVPDALDADERLSDTDRRVYGALVRCFRLGATSGNPPIVRVAERAHRHRNTVKRSLARLAELQYVHRRHEAGRPAHYTLMRLVEAPDGKVALPGFEPGGGPQLRADTGTTAQRSREPTSKRLEKRAEGAAAAQGPNGNPNDTEVLEPAAWPTGPFGKRLDPHAWDHVSTNGNGSRPTP